MDTDLESKVQLLMAMGFPAEYDIRRALRLSKNDVNEAVAYLTNEMPGLDDMDTIDASTSNALVPIDGSASSSLEFPTTNLYELEGRVFVSQWSIPFRKDESLGRCLAGATELTKLKLMESDDSCCRFINKVLPECFEKLLDSPQVKTWDTDVQNGINIMIQMFLNLVAAHASSETINRHIYGTLAKIVDPNTEYHQKNRMHHYDRDRFSSASSNISHDHDNVAPIARPPRQNSTFATTTSTQHYHQYGYLVDALNKLQELGFYEEIENKFITPVLSAQDMYYVLKPFAVSAAFLNSDVAMRSFDHCLQTARDYVWNLTPVELQTSDAQYVVDLMNCCKIISHILNPLRDEDYDETRLDFILRLLKCNHFAARMLALKEITKILKSYVSPVSRPFDRSDVSLIPTKLMQDWLSKNDVLTLALEGNLDQPQYCDRLKSLLDFLGPRMNSADIQKIWHLRQNRTANIVENIYTIVAQAAPKLAEKELGHLLNLIKRSWKDEGPKGREKLLTLIGKIGCEGTLSHAYISAASLLWELSHSNGLQPELISKALYEHLGVITKFGREDERNKYIMSCLEDIEKGAWILPAITQLHEIIKSTGTIGIGFQQNKGAKQILNNLIMDQNHDLVSLLCDCLKQSHITVHKEVKLKDSKNNRFTVVGDSNLDKPKVYLIPATPAAGPRPLLSVNVSPMDTSTPIRSVNSSSTVTFNLDDRGTSPSPSPSVVNMSTNDDRSEEHENHVLDDGFSYHQRLTVLLHFLKYVLKESDRFLEADKAAHLIEIFVDSTVALPFERDEVLGWFANALGDLDSPGKLNFFNHLLQQNPTYLTKVGFECFKKYFEDVNKDQGRISRAHQYADFVVEKLDLIGLEFIWRIALCSTDVEIVDDAILLLIKYQYSDVNSRYRKEAEKLHKRFLDECQKKLLETVLSDGESTIAQALTSAFKVSAGIACTSVFSADDDHRSPISNSGSMRMMNIERLLLIAERYIRTVEGDKGHSKNSFASNSSNSGGQRLLGSIPHGISFVGTAFRIRVSAQKPFVDTRYEAGMFVHSCELVSSLRARIARRVDIEPHRVILEQNDGTEIKAPDECAKLTDVGICPDGITFIQTKNRISPGTYGGSGFDRSLEGGWNSSIKTRSGSTQSLCDWEKNFPSIILSKDPQVFETLYRLYAGGVPTIKERVRSLLLILPTDPVIIESLENLGNFSTLHVNGDGMSKTMSKESVNSASSSPGTTSKTNSLERIKSKLWSKAGASNSSLSQNCSLSTTDDVLKFLFTCTESDSEYSSAFPFRLWYNLEALNGKLNPPLYNEAGSLANAQRFCDTFITVNGLSYIMNIIDQNFLPNSTDLALRRSIYEQCIDILRFLLCGSSTLVEIINSEQDIVESPSNPSVKTFGCRTSATASASVLQIVTAPVSQSIKKLPDAAFSKLLSSLQRLCWAAAGGALYAINTAELIGVHNAKFQMYAQGSRSRTSESSTTSSEDLPSSMCSPLGSSSGSSSITLHDAVRLQTGHSGLSDDDRVIALTCFRLLVQCARERIQPLVGTRQLFSLPAFPQFVMDMLLGCSSDQVRRTTFHELYDLCRSLSLDGVYDSSSGQTPNSSVTDISSESGYSSANSDRTVIVTGETFRPDLCLLGILQKPVPLWQQSCSIRTQKHMSQCREYFMLRAHLIECLSALDLALLKPPPEDMLNSERDWLFNYSCSTSADLAEVDNVAIEAHLMLVVSLLKVVPTARRRLGESLLKRLIQEFMFPASCLLLETGRNTDAWRHVKTSNLMAKCRATSCRHAAFSLLLEMCKSDDNLFELSLLLQKLHHFFDPELAKEWDYHPLVDEKMDGNFVGLKNAGATCYMNSVLQQLFLQPLLPQQILGSELEGDEQNRLLYELQRIFGYLSEMDAQYFIPKGFWDTFRLWGERVNPREQQDAFEFYTDLINQIDDYLQKNNSEPVFKPRFQGVFSDQKICKECPHRYEREEDFFAVNVDIAGQNLEESLKQFVKGELLEGDNAVFCEKCNAKRTVLKRLCIKTLPPVLTIHLKRFHFDYEENRPQKFNDFFEFPMSLDMYPYTAAGLEELYSEVEWDAGNTSNLSGLAGLGTPSGSTITSPLPKKNSMADMQHPFGVSPVSRKSMSEAQFLSTSAGSSKTTPVLGKSFEKRTSFLLHERQRYNLVGVIVHSGQASAGHYYALVKDRRGDLSTNKTFGKWFKFNDTTVEPVEMTDQFMETELFGGKYTVKEKTSFTLNYPEERERYWNAYMLLYQQDTRESYNVSVVPKQNPKRTVSANYQTQATKTKNPCRRDTLVELKELVEEGDRSQLFNDFSFTMPSSIRQEIREDNLRFARDRDLYASDYRTFIYQLCLQVSRNQSASSSSICSCLELAMHFLLDTEWHLRKSVREAPCHFGYVLDNMMIQSEAAVIWLMAFFANTEMHTGSGMRPGAWNYLELYMLECTEHDVRQVFSTLVMRVLVLYSAIHRLPLDDLNFDKLLNTYISFASKEAISNYKNSQEYFQSLVQFMSNLGPLGVQELLKRDGFKHLMTFLLQYNETQTIGNSSIQLQKRWNPGQARDFTNVYSLISACVLQCDLSCCNTSCAPPGGVEKLWSSLESVKYGLEWRLHAAQIKSQSWDGDNNTTAPQNSDSSSDQSTKVDSTTRASLDKRDLPNLLGSTFGDSFELASPTTDMQCVLYGELQGPFVTEIVWAFMNVGIKKEKEDNAVISNEPETFLSDLAIYCSYCNLPFSIVLLKEVLCQIRFNNDLKLLLRLLKSLLSIEDALQAERISFCLDGFDPLINIISNTDGVPSAYDSLKHSVVHGLLAIIKNCSDDNVKKCYACVKLLTGMTDVLPLRDALNVRLDRWKWITEWLRSKMDQKTSSSTSSTSTSYSPTKNFNSSLSNDDYSTRTGFMRTKSAQHTLEQADELLKEALGESEQIFVGIAENASDSTDSVAGLEDESTNFGDDLNSTLETERGDSFSPEMNSSLTTDMETEEM